MAKLWEASCNFAPVRPPSCQFASQVTLEPDENLSLWTLGNVIWSRFFWRSEKDEFFSCRFLHIGDGVKFIATGPRSEWPPLETPKGKGGSDKSSFWLSQTPSSARISNLRKISGGKILIEFNNFLFPIWALQFQLVINISDIARIAAALLELFLGNVSRCTLPKLLEDKRPSPDIQLWRRKHQVFPFITRLYWLCRSQYQSIA